MGWRYVGNKNYKKGGGLTGQPPKEDSIVVGLSILNWKTKCAISKCVQTKISIYS